MNSLSYEQRTRAIFDFLYRKSEPLGILRRYRLPEHLSDDAIRAEVNDLVEELNGSMPEALTEGRLGAILKATKDALRRRHGAAGWPPAKVFLASVADAMEAIDRKGTGDGGSAQNAMLDRMEEWFNKFGTVLPACNSQERTRALIDRGTLTARQARHAGFMMSADLLKEAKDAPMCEAERKQHVRVMARLWKVSEQEAQDRLEEEGQIPTEQLASELDAAGRNIDARNKAVKERGRGA